MKPLPNKNVGIITKTWADTEAEISLMNFVYLELRDRDFTVWSIITKRGLKGAIFTVRAKYVRIATALVSASSDGMGDVTKRTAADDVSQ
jgi:hypothetical protein